MLRGEEPNKEHHFPIVRANTGKISYMKKPMRSSEDTVGNSLIKSPKNDLHDTTSSKREELQTRNETIDRDENSNQVVAHRVWGGIGLQSHPTNTGASRDIGQENCSGDMHSLITHGITNPIDLIDKISHHKLEIHKKWKRRAREKGTKPNPIKISKVFFGK